MASLEKKPMANIKSDFFGLSSQLKKLSISDRAVRVPAYEPAQANFRYGLYKYA